ncbi:MAG: hypothetical protein KDA42_06510 [Planctomycetales bacterium]|nr:hypothetical protein [Planctomycetales bacterium]
MKSATVNRIYPRIPRLAALALLLASTGCGTSGYVERMEATKKKLLTGGADTPEAAFADFTGALAQQNWQKLLTTLEPESGGFMFGQMVGMSVALGSRDQRLKQIMESYGLDMPTLSLPGPGSGPDGLQQFQTKLMEFLGELQATLSNRSLQAQMFSDITVYISEKDKSGNWTDSLPMKIETPFTYKAKFMGGQLEGSPAANGDRAEATCIASDGATRWTIVFSQSDGRWYVNAMPPTGRPAAAAPAADGNTETETDAE